MILTNKNCLKVASQLKCKIIVSFEIAKSGNDVHRALQLAVTITNLVPLTSFLEQILYFPASSAQSFLNQTKSIKFHLLPLIKLQPENQ